jgi:putative DNA primase/helicase
LNQFSDLFNSYVMIIKGRGVQKTGLCPFHEDTNESFSFNEDTGLWICFAGCGEGNAYQFAEKVRVDPRPYITNSDPVPIVKMKTEELDEKDKRLILSCHEYLIANYSELVDLPWDLEVVKKYYVGYHKEKKCFTFPHFNKDGKAINIKFHKSESGDPPHSIKGHGQNRFYPHIITASELVFVEGEKDFITLESNGFDAITVTTGAMSLPFDLSILENVEKITIVLDNDLAGIQGSIKIAEELKKRFPSMIVEIVSWDKALPNKYDVTDFFSEKDSTEFQKILSNAEVNHNTAKQETTVKPIINFPLTDSGNAELLNYLYADQMRFNHTISKWVIWNGQYWEIDKSSSITQFVILSARQRQKDAISINDNDKKSHFINYGIKSENQNMISSTLKIAKSLKGIKSSSKDWDGDDFLLQFTNGVLELKTNKFRDGNPSDMISICTGHSYDPTCDCPKWTQAIFEIMAEDQNMVDFIQRAVGYSLSGSTSEQCFFLLYGNGANGKSVVLEIIRFILGDYSKDSPFTAFERRNSGNSQTNELARLNSARLITSSESGTSKMLDEERLKAITGGDPVTARYLYQEYFTYYPKFKIWLAVNSLPRTEDFSDGFWRRVRVIPFDVKFKGDNADPNLLEKLKKEIQGILNWAFTGFLAWQKTGLKPPNKVIQATKEYQVESDVVAEFLDGNVKIVKGVENTIHASDLYQRFCSWFKTEYTGNPISQTLFGKRASMVFGFPSHKIGGRKVYVGVKYVLL